MMSRPSPSRHGRVGFWDGHPSMSSRCGLSASCRSRGESWVASCLESKPRPNNSPQQTAHASKGCPRHYALSRVRPLLGCGVQRRRVLRMSEPVKLPDGVSTHTGGSPEFIGQQTGVAADLLHSEFGTALVALPQVERAYFCQLRYPGAERNGAAVCVVSRAGEDMRVVEALAAVI